MPPWEGSDTIDALLAQVAHFHHAHIRRGIESLGLYRGQPRMLHLLWQHDGLTHTELAKALHVQPATVSKMVQRMERSGFVERRRDAEDERVSNVYLTDLGRNVKDQVESSFTRLQDDYTQGLSAEDLATLRRLLLHLRDRLAASYGDEEPELEASPPHGLHRRKHHPRRAATL